MFERLIVHGWNAKHMMRSAEDFFRDVLPTRASQRSSRRPTQWSPPANTAANRFKVPH